MAKIQAKGFINKNGDQIEMIPTAHTHAIADIDELQTQLGGKANTGHSHSIANVTGLQSALDTKVSTSLVNGNSTGVIINTSKISLGNNTVDCECAVAEGFKTLSSGKASHAEGSETKATYEGAHAEGANTEASNICAHAEGRDTKALGRRSHTEGYGTTANGDNSHAEGFNTEANGDASHTEGSGTIAKGDYSHAEGIATCANAAFAHVEGSNTIADGECSHAEGSRTQTTHKAEHAEGKFNLSNSFEKPYIDSNLCIQCGGACDDVCPVDAIHFHNEFPFIDSDSCLGCTKCFEACPARPKAIVFGGTIHSIGIGSEDNRCNAVEVMENGNVFVLGVGGYKGTNPLDATTLQEVVNSKAETTHTHTIQNITNLQTQLNNKAAATHTHTDLQTQINDLQTGLNSKANKSHTHNISNISGLSETLSKFETTLTTILVELHNSDEFILLPELFKEQSDNNTSRTILLHIFDGERTVQHIFRSDCDEDIVYLRNWCSDVAEMPFNHHTLYIFRVILCEEAMRESVLPAKYFIMLDGMIEDVF